MVPKELGYRTRGIDVDRKGIIWMALASQQPAGELRSHEVPAP